VRFAIHANPEHEHQHPHLHHHILWAVFVLIVFLILFSRSVAGQAVAGTDEIVAVESGSLGWEVV
jgi:hypothetical protein